MKRKKIEKILAWVAVIILASLVLASIAFFLYMKFFWQMPELNLL